MHDVSFYGNTKYKKRFNDVETLCSVVPEGLEPPQTEPKTVVLPLHHGTIASAKV